MRRNEGKNVLLSGNEVLNTVFNAIKNLDNSHGVTAEEIVKYVSKNTKALTAFDRPFDKSHAVEMTQILKDLIKSEFIFECIPDFETLPKTPKRYKVWNKNEND